MNNVEKCDQPEHEEEEGVDIELEVLFLVAPVGLVLGGGAVTSVVQSDVH